MTRLAKSYKPSKQEPFMNARQREYFRRKLLAWRADIVEEMQEAVRALQNGSTKYADIADRASSESEKALELRSRDRLRKLIAKIDSALERIAQKTYGYCEETGEPIDLKRLDARPVATLSLEAQERHEKREKIYRDT